MSKQRKKQTLAEAHPELAAQWHPTKNGDLTPDRVTPGSGKKVWWILPHDDPETGKHFDFEWPQIIGNRVKGAGCPFFTGKAVYPGFNDLATKRPELAKEWHPTKNGTLTPEMVTFKSEKKVMWLLPYDDPETGSHFDFEWEAKICNRSSGGGCPYLSGQAVWKGFNDLATKYPELAKQWHPTKNGKLAPDKVACQCNKKVWWICENGHKWKASVTNRTRGTKCPACARKLITQGINDLETTSPELAAQWHPTKNGVLSPQNINRWSRRAVWWLYPYDDPKTGKHFDFEWKATIESRVKGVGCPFISGMAVWPGFNDLATHHPELVKQWHPTKNGDLTPTTITCGSKKKVWWIFPYDDPETGKHFDFEWSSYIFARVNDKSCPFLSGHDVWPGYNDLATKFPEIAKEWHPKLNRSKTPKKTYQFSTRKVWWQCLKCGHEWYSAVFSRTIHRCACPRCKKTASKYVLT